MHGKIRAFLMKFAVFQFIGVSKRYFCRGGACSSHVFKRNKYYIHLIWLCQKQGAFDDNYKIFTLLYNKAFTFLVKYDTIG